MKKLVLILAVAIFCNAAFAGNSLIMDITGIINSGQDQGIEGDWMQVGPNGENDSSEDPFAWGSIDSYLPSGPDVPTVGDDLGKYGWGMVGNVDLVDEDNNLMKYSGTWSVAYKYDSVDYDVVETGDFSMTANFTDDWSTASVTGVMNATPGDVEWAGALDGVDWSSLNPAWMMEGTFTSSTNELKATVIAPVPVPGALLLGGLGVGCVSYLRRRRSL